MNFSSLNNPTSADTYQHVHDVLLLTKFVTKRPEQKESFSLISLTVQQHPLGRDKLARQQTTPRDSRSDLASKKLDKTSPTNNQISRLKIWVRPHDINRFIFEGIGDAKLSHQLP
ncbi:hypothetical protein MCOR25_001665 [Pyricularia grisea]|nr:hypothetical protein MCOR25_001665 [Pyricularia grisea]